MMAAFATALVARRESLPTILQVAEDPKGRGGKLAGTGALKRRIMDMGLTKGTRLRVRKVAPLGDPVELSVRGYELSIRKYEADSIEVVDVRSDKD